MRWSKSRWSSSSSKSKNKRKRVRRISPCNYTPGSQNCRRATPGIAQKNGGRYEPGNRAYCGGCHIDLNHSQEGLGIQSQIRETRMISVLQEAETKVQRPRTKKPAAAKSVAEKRTVKKRPIKKEA